LQFSPEPAIIFLSVETVNTKNTMSHYEILLKQYETIAHTFHHKFPETGLLESLEEELDELEENLYLSEVERLNNCNLIVE